MPRKKMKVIEVRGSSQEPHLPSPWAGKTREVLAFGLILMALYAVISLVTYRPTDVPSIFWDPSRHGFASNKGGTLGASLAGFLYRYLGLTAYLLAFFGCFWGVVILLRREIRDALAKLAGVVLFLGAAATLLSLATPDDFDRTSLFRSATLPGLGGAYGNASRDLLVLYIGPVGAVMAMLLVLSVSMVLATDWMIYFGLMRLGRVTAAAVLGMSAAARRFHGAWAQMPPLLQAAAHDAHVRVPAAPEPAGEVERGSDPAVAAAGGWTLSLRAAIASVADFFTGSGHEPVTIRTGPELPETPPTSTAIEVAEPRRWPTPPPTRDRKSTRRVRIVDDATTSGAAAPGDSSSPGATDSKAPVAAPVAAEAPVSAPAPAARAPLAPDRAPLSAAPADPAAEARLTLVHEDPPSDAERNEDEADEPAAPPAAVQFTPGFDEETEEEAPAADAEADLEEPAEPESEIGAATGGEAAPAVAHPAVTVNLGPKSPSLDGAPPAPVAPERAPRKETRPFHLPPMSLLEDPVPTPLPTLERDIEQRIKTIEAALECFGVPARVVHVDRGPSITMYELELAPGIRVNKIMGMGDDLSIALKVPSVRIVAPIPGKSSIGIEVPNALKEAVRLKELVLGQDQHWKNFALPLFLGKDVSGMHVVKNLEEMPHLLVAGTTGSGKSVCLSTIILSLLLTRTPEDLKLILVDPKMVELSMFKDMPHLLSPVVTDMKRAPVVLDWVVRCMEERYDLMARAGVKKISTFNSLGEAKIRERLGVEPDVDVPTFLPRIVVVIDELADLMMVASKEVEFAITRLAQKSRAVGIHLVLATQRPSVDVITGLIKSNMPARIAFKVASGIDSRTILDHNGAERLLGKGDMLLSVPGSMELLRTQCSYVADNEIADVVQFLKDQGAPVFDQDLVEVAEGEQITSGEQDELYAEAVRVVVETGRGSTSLLQRKLEIGYTRAARLVDFMAKDGIVGAYKGSKAREVLMTPDMYRARFVTRED